MNLAAQETGFDQVLDSSATGSANGVPVWLQQQQQQAKDIYRQIGFPQRKQETWKYTSIEKLTQHAFEPATAYSDVSLQAQIQIAPIAQLDAYQMVFVDGIFRRDLSNLEQLPQGVALFDLRQAMQKPQTQLETYLGKIAKTDSNAFVALNAAVATEGVYVSIAERVVLDKPIELVFVASGENEKITSLPRTVINLQDGAKATVIERFVSARPSFYFQNVVVEINLATSAQLQHYRFIAEAQRACHLSSVFLQQAGGSHYHGLNLGLSAAWARSDFHVDLNGADAHTQLDGMYLVNSQELADVHTNIEHHAATCSSKQTFRGLLLGAGRAVFDGRILVEKAAQHTDAGMSNDNLLLSNGAEVDSKPQLEIYADNVKCSHGTTVGQLDPEQVFYLRSRGIDGDLARHMICQGFVSEVLDQVQNQAIRTYAETSISQILDQHLRV